MIPFPSPRKAVGARCSVGMAPVGREGKAAGRRPAAGESAYAMAGATAIIGVSPPGERTSGKVSNHDVDIRQFVKHASGEPFSEGWAIRALSSASASNSAPPRAIIVAPSVENGVSVHDGTAVRGTACLDMYLGAGGHPPALSVPPPDRVRQHRPSCSWCVTPTPACLPPCSPTQAVRDCDSLVLGSIRASEDGKKSPSIPSDHRTK